MSITNKTFARIEGRGHWLESFYYRERCLFNATLMREKGERDEEENMLDQAHRLNDLLERVHGDRTTKPRMRD